MTAVSRTVGGGHQRALRDTMLPANCIIIVTDDERYDWIRGKQLATRPIIQSRLLSQGTHLRRYCDNYCICAPSRGTIFTGGQYWWNSGMHNEIDVPNFDYTRSMFKDLRGPDGSRRFNTFMVGKVLNNWGNPNTLVVPPNQWVDTWDRFAGSVTNLVQPISDANCHATNGSAVITSSTAAFSAATHQGKRASLSVTGLPVSDTTILSVDSPTQVTLSDTFQGTTTTTAKLYAALASPSPNEQSKSKYAMFKEVYDAVGTATSTTHFFANYSAGNPATYGDYQTDNIKNEALTFLAEVVARPNGDARQGLPFVMYLTPAAGHTPFQDPPVYTPDATNRAARMAQYDTFVRDIFDTSTAESGTSTAIGTATVTDESGSWTAQTLTDSSKNWTVDQWLHCVVYTGTAMGVVIANTATQLIIGEWLLQGSGNVIYTGTGSNGHLDPSSDLNWSLTSAPSPGAYTMSWARPDIDQAAEVNTVHNNLDERRTGREMVAVDDMIEAICAYLENQDGQYSLENTYVIYMSDNSVVRGEKGSPADKGFPQFVDFHCPCVIRGPGIPAGVSVDFHMSTVDIGATIMGLLGQTANATRVTDGLDLSPYLKGEQPWSTKGNRVFLHNGNPQTSTHGVITSRWRYYHDAAPPQNMPTDYIFNWRKDPLELRNLWNTAEVGTGTGAAGGSSSIQGDLTSLDSAHYNTGESGVTLSGVTYP